MLKKELQIYINRYIWSRGISWKPKTLSNINNRKKLLLDYLGDDKDFNKETIIDYSNYLKNKGYAESTRQQAETFVKAFTRWLHEEGYTESDWAARLKRTHVNHQSHLLPSQGEMHDLIHQATEPTKPGEKGDNVITRFSKNEHRDFLNFILTCCGGRNYESRQIKKDDVSISGRQIILAEGKTGPRMCGIPEVPWLVDMIERRTKKWTSEAFKILSDKSHYKGDFTNRLFAVNEKKAEETMRKAGEIWGKPLCVHDLRRVFARDMKKNGADIDDIRIAMGHKNIETTLRYLYDDPSEIQRILRQYNSEARKYWTRAAKIEELYARIQDIGQIVRSNDDSKEFVDLRIRLI